jgi:ADP-ribose pyrophosphatase YjhB (NUDIX family)
MTRSDPSRWLDWVRRLQAVAHNGLHYALDVRGVVARGEELLLVRGTDDGRWTLPGGWAEVGEKPSEAVEKEVLQEAGFQVRASGLLAVLNRDVRHRPRFPFHGWKLYFRCEEVAEVGGDGIETDAYGFFAEDALPELSHRTPPEHLARMFAHVRDPSLPTDFD